MVLTQITFTVQILISFFSGCHHRGVHPKRYSQDLCLSLFLIYLQPGSVYIFGESVAPSGGDNKCFIWVYLKTARAAMLFIYAAENYTVLILHSTQINLINTTNNMEEIVKFLFNVILYLTLYSAVKKKDNTSVYQHIKSPH